jgi:hypothetical protein
MPATPDRSGEISAGINFKFKHGMSAALTVRRRPTAGQRKINANQALGRMDQILQSRVVR